MCEDELPLIRNAKDPEDWRLNREVRFTWRQQSKREWIPFRDIAEWFAELGGSGANEGARANAYNMLQRDFLNGDFEEAGRSRVLYLHFRTPMAKMTRNRLQTAIDALPVELVRSEYLGRCWLPRPMFQRWLGKHELPLSPARFRPWEVGELDDTNEATSDSAKDTGAKSKIALKDHFAAHTNGPKKRRSGRKSLRPAIRHAVFKLMDYHGDLSDDDPKWSKQADVEKAILEKLSENAPAESTVRLHVSASIVEWRKQKITEGR